MTKIQKGKAACIVILAALFIISLIDVILRATVFSDIITTAGNYGEVLITAAFAALLIIFLLAKKDRVFYLLCGAFIGYFVLSQLFGLVTWISPLVESFTNGIGEPDLGSAALLVRLLAMICIIVIGGLLVEYMNDGTIYNKAFNIFCLIALVCYILQIVIVFLDATIIGSLMSVILLNILSEIAMLFLFTVFAYVSAKKQLDKVNF